MWPSMPDRAERGVEYNPQVDLLPLLADVSFDEYDAYLAVLSASGECGGTAGNSEKPTLAALAAEAAGVDAETILGEDLFLYTRREGKMMGTPRRVVLSPRWIDLQSAFCRDKSFYGEYTCKYINLCAVFDNEEVGSGTRRGAIPLFWKILYSGSQRDCRRGTAPICAGWQTLPDLCGQCPCGTSQPSGKSRPCQPPVSKRRNRH